MEFLEIEKNFNEMKEKALKSLRREKIVSYLNEYVKGIFPSKLALNYIYQNKSNLVSFPSIFSFSIMEMTNQAVAYMGANKLDHTFSILSKLDDLTEPNVYGFFTNERSYIYNQFGCFYRRVCKLETSLNYFEKAEKLSESCQNKKYLSLAYMNKGALYSQIGKHILAIEFSQKAIVQAEKELSSVPDVQKGDEQLQEAYIRELAKIIAISYHNLGLEEEHFSNFENAKKFYELSIHICKESDYPHPLLEAAFKKKFESFIHRVESIRTIVKLKERVPGETYLNKEKKAIISRPLSSNQRGQYSSLRGLPRQENPVFIVKRGIRDPKGKTKFVVFNHTIEKHLKESEEIQNKKLVNITHYMEDQNYQSLFHDDSLLENIMSKEETPKPESINESTINVLFENRHHTVDCYLNKNSIIRNPTVYKKTEFLCTSTVDEIKKTMNISIVDPIRDSSTSSSFMFRINEYWSLVNENDHQEIFEDLIGISIQVLKALVYANGLFPRAIVQKKGRSIRIYSKLLEFSSKELSLGSLGSNENYCLIVSEQIVNSGNRPVSAHVFLEKVSRPTSKYTRRDSINSMNRKTSPMKGNQHEHSESNKKETIQKRSLVKFKINSELMLMKHSYIDSEDINELKNAIRKPVKAKVFEDLKKNLQFNQNVGHLLELLEDYEFFALKNSFCILKRYSFTSFKRDIFLISRSFRSLHEQSRGCLVSNKFATLLDKRILTYNHQPFTLYFFLVIEKEQLMIRSLHKEITPLHVDLYDKYVSPDSLTITQSIISKVYLRKVNADGKIKFIISTIDEGELFYVKKLQRIFRRIIISRKNFKILLANQNFQFEIKIIRNGGAMGLIITNQGGFLDIPAKARHSLSLERNSSIKPESLISRIRLNQNLQKVKIDLSSNKFLLMRKVNYQIEGGRTIELQYHINPDLDLIKIVGIENNVSFQQEMKGLEKSSLKKSLDFFQNDFHLKIDFEPSFNFISKSNNIPIDAIYYFRGELLVNDKILEAELTLYNLSKDLRLQICSTVVKNYKYIIKSIILPKVNIDYTIEIIHHYLMYSPSQIISFDKDRLLKDIRKNEDELEAKDINLKDNNVKSAALLIQKKYRKKIQNNPITVSKDNENPNKFLSSFKIPFIPQINVNSNRITLQGQIWSKELDLEEEVKDEEKTEIKAPNSLPRSNLKKISKLEEFSNQQTYERVILEKGSESEKESQSYSPEQKFLKRPFTQAYNQEINHIDEFQNPSPKLRRISVEKISNTSQSNSDSDGISNEQDEDIEDNQAENKIIEESENDSSSYSENKSLLEDSILKSPSESEGISPTKLRNSNQSSDSEEEEKVDKRIHKSNAELSIIEDGISPKINLHSVNPSMKSLPDKVKPLASPLFKPNPLLK